MYFMTFVVAVVLWLYMYVTFSHISAIYLLDIVLKDLNCCPATGRHSK